CKSCGGDSDSLIFLTPVQSMKLGMSILDTFHERKLKQLNQRLQNMILNHFSVSQTQSTSNNQDDDHHQISDRKSLSDEKNLIQNFYQNFYQQDFNDKEKYFQELRNKIKQVNFLTKNMRQSTSFNPIESSHKKVLAWSPLAIQSPSEYT
ncbi:unnamed protein product, partial [Adineta steineri]